MPKPNGDAGDAVDWALDYIDDPMASVRFLDDWRLGDLTEWPEYLHWVKHQQSRAADVEEEKAIAARIEALRSKQKRVGPFRQAGIQQTIRGLKQQLSVIRRGAKE